MKKYQVLIMLLVIFSVVSTHKIPTPSPEKDIQTIKVKITKFSSYIEFRSGIFLDESSNDTFPVPDTFQRRAIAIIIIGSIPVGIIFLIILYQSRRRKRKKTF